MAEGQKQEKEERYEKREMDAKEARIRQITKLYYSNPKLQEYLIEFGRNREVVPRYYEGFGKRPDMIQYPSDIVGLVQKGATSLHCSEEIWLDPLQLQSSMTPDEQNKLRKNWDLLIDIDSPYLDFSKVACVLVCNALEEFGIYDYGIKYSGSKGFHIILSGDAFPEEMDGMKRSEHFPQWPRAIVGYLMSVIKPEYGRRITKMDINLEALKRRTNLTEKDITEFLCPNCQQKVEQTTKVTLECDDCGTIVERPNMKATNRILRCTNCPGNFRIVKEEPYFFCKNCGTRSMAINHGEEGNAVVLSRAAREQSRNYNVNFEKTIAGEELGDFDLVLVAPRHLFRMPYSLHEKKCLASVVVDKNKVESFTPADANAMKIELKPFLKAARKNSGAELLRRAWEWHMKKVETEKLGYEMRAKESGMQMQRGKKDFEQKDYSHATENDFPEPIKKLLKGLEDGKKRGLFILLSFFRSIGYNREKTDLLVRQWNEKNVQPLKEGYIRSQVEWHYRQRKPIMPPNYTNDAFYKDLGLLSSRPKSKNPMADIAWKMRSR